MKILLILAWAVVSVAILWWPRPPGFNTRWVSMPPAMSWEMLARARQSAERPAAMTYTHCKWPQCRLS
jgi:hypothetical protein